jgi:hypothetical protein
VLERRVVKEPKVDENLDKLGETLVTEGTTNDGLGFRNVVELAEGSRVAVGVANEGEGGVDVVRLGVLHQVLAVDFDELTLLVELGRVEEGEEDTARGPGELVTEGVVGGSGGGETTAVRKETGDLAAGLVNLVDGFDGVEVVDLWEENKLATM